MTETWLPVPGLEGYYEASDQGRVRSLDRVITKDGRPIRLKGVVLKQSIHKSGYATVSMCREGRQYVRKVHQVILETFIGARPSGTEGCHTDGDKLNNTPSNLRWDTRAANVADMIRHGTFWAQNKTHCVNGHLYTTETTYNRPGGNHRECYECRRIRAQIRLDEARTMPHSSERTHCPQGHAYTVDNTSIITTGPGKKGRRCRKCHNERTRLQQQRRRQLAKEVKGQDG